MAQGICSVDDCEKTAVGRGWCPAHWYRWKNYGDPLVGKPLELFRAVDHDDGTRTCSKCRERKPLAEFHRVKSATLGRRSDCKACRSRAMQVHYERNRDEIRAKNVARYLANPQPARERERLRNRLPERLELHAERVALRRARMAGARTDPGVTRSNLRIQYGSACFYCSVEMNFDRRSKGDPWPPNLATVEHVIPISRGGTHTWDNVVIACWDCNCSKHDSTPDEWAARR